MHLSSALPEGKVTLYVFSSLDFIGLGTSTCHVATALAIALVAFAVANCLCSASFYCCLAQILPSL